MSLSVTVEEMTPKVFTVYPIGAIDTSTYGILEEKIETLLQRAVRTLIFDMKHVDYLSSAGVRVILKTKKMLKKHGGSIVLVHLQPQIQKVFEIMQILPTMPIFANIEELDRYLDQIQQQVKEDLQ